MLKTKQYIIIGVATLLMSSCSVWKNYESETTVPTDVFGTDIQTTADSLAGWRNVFADPQLQTLIARALENNSDIRIAEQTMLQAEAALTSAKFGYLPTLAFSPTGSIGRFGSATVKDYKIPLVASWQADIFGSITNTKRQAKAQVAYEQDYRQALGCQLVASVATYYYTLVLLDSQTEVAENMLKICEESHQAMQALFESGVYMSPAVYQQEAQISGIKAQILDIQKAVRETEAALCLLLNETPHTIARGKMNDTILTSVLFTGVPADILHNRPDVRAAERSLESAYYGVQISKAQLYPNLTIDGSGGWMNPGQWFVSGAASLVAPIFQQGKLRANVRISEAEQEKARIALEHAIIKAGNEVNTAMFDSRIAEQKASLIKEQVDKVHETYLANQELMNNGQATYLEVLTAQNQLFSAQLSQLSNEYDRIAALISLYAALGGR